MTDTHVDDTEEDNSHFINGILIDIISGNRPN